MNRRWLPLFLCLAAVLLLALVVPRAWQTLRLHQALAGIESEDEARVAEARDALLDCGERAVAPLLDLVGQSGDARDQAAQVLHAMDADLVRRVVAEQVAAADPELRVRVSRAVGWLGDPDLAAPALPLLEDAEEEVRKAAVVALGFVRSEEALPRIRRLFVTGGEGLRGVCARALACYGREEDRPLLERARQDPSAYVRGEVERALADLESADSSAPEPDDACKADGSPESEEQAGASDRSSGS